MSNGKPRVSVALPVFNGDRYLEEALDSVLAQTFEDFELIVSDNASTDATQDICMAYAARDRRVRYYRNEDNLGAAWNYNRLFGLSTGEYFKWAAHDDRYAPEYLERCVAALDRMPSVVLCYPKTVLIDEHGDFLGYYRDDFNLCSPLPHERYNRCHGCLSVPRLCNPVFGLIRSSILRSTPLFGNYVAADKVLLAELALLGKFYEIPDRLFFRRDHPYRSVRANIPHDERAAWLDPRNKGKILMPTWRSFLEHLFCVRRVHMKWSEKWCCYKEVGGWMWRNRRMMKHDVIAAGKKVLLRWRPTRWLAETIKRSRAA